MKDNILELIGGKYHTAIITTFNFDINFFDTKVVPKLEINDIKNILLFVDAKEFEKSIESICSSYVGKKYNVIPVKMNASFHPKLFLMLGEDAAKLIIGSFNQTRAGYLTNQEIYNCFEYDNSENIGNLNLIQSVMHFIENLIKIIDVKDEIVDILHNIYYLGVKSTAKNEYFISSFQDSIIEQLKKIIVNKVTSIQIAVPFYDDELRALKDISSIFECSDIKLFVQNGKSTFPIKYNEENDIIKKIFKFGKIGFNESDNFYHGKVIKFNTNSESYILYGSSNCTLAALFKSFRDGGNIESNILAKGNIKDYNSFFDEFIVSDKKEFTKFEEEKYDNIKKEYILDKVCLNGNNVEISIKYITEPTKILLKGEELQLNYDNNFIKIEIEKNRVDTIFELSIVSDQEYCIKCFYNDLSRIKDYRHSEKTKYSIPEHLLNKDNIMLNDLVDIIACLPTDKVQIKENIDIAKSYISKKNENESDDLTEEYEIDNEKLIEYAKKYNDNNKIKAIASHISDNYFLSLINDKLKIDSEHNYTGNTIPSSCAETQIKEIDIEQYNDHQCKKLITKLVEKLTYDDFAEALDYKSYKDYVGISLSYLDKYQETFNDKKLLSNSKILEYKYNVLLKLLKKEYCNELAADEEKSIIVAVFILVIEMTLHNNDDNNDNKDKNNEPKVKQLLESLSNYHTIKNYDNEFEQSMSIIKNKGLLTFEYNFKKLIDDIIGYLNFDNIKKAIDDLISGKKDILYKNKKLIVIIETEEIEKGLQFNTSPKMKKIKKLIKSYSSKVETINNFDILLNNKLDGNIIKMEFTYVISDNETKRNIYYKDGKVWKEEY
ncbi:MAG: hypothetical protein RSA15_03705 [Bacilli bacterium]